MSDNWIRIVPKQPKYIPPKEKTQTAIQVLERLFPNADEIKVIQHNDIQLFDCGANLETITCPRCKSDISFEWWETAMDADYDVNSGFQLHKHNTECCSKSVSLNDLIYDFHQAFGCIAISALNANVGELPVSAITKIEAALECGITVVYQHI